MTATVRPEVAAYVTAVRRELDDLSTDEVDELVGGLEADLDDALADRSTPDGDPAVVFGAPAAYAAELRSAAGLPPRAAAAGRPGVGERLAATRRRWTARLAGQRWWPGVRDFALTMRPVWWVSRAGVIVLLFAGSPAGAVLPFLVLAVVSVEVGRRRLAARSGLARWVVRVVNALAVLMFLPVLGQVLTPSTAYVESAVIPQDGLWLNGVEVRNVLPYDSEGRPLYGVQLFDENGRPLDVGQSARLPLWWDTTVDGLPRGTAQVPQVTDRGGQAWNVYPLRQVEVREGGSSGEGGLDEGRQVGEPTYPAPDPASAPRVLLPPSDPASAQPPATPSPAPSNLAASPGSTPATSPTPVPSPSR